MKRTQKLALKHLILFIVGGLMYMGVELLWRQRTHWTMGIVGGLCFVEIGLINEILAWDTKLIMQMLIGSYIVTVNELVFGIIINIILGWNVWDYSNLPLNFLGQVCLLFSFLWIFVSAVAIMLDDYIRYKYFNEERPRYYICKKIWYPFK